MIFTFAVCSFTEAELNTLQKAPVGATLARIGINRNTSCDIIFGSSLYGGLGFQHSFVEQGIAQLQLLIHHLRADTSQGSLMLIGLSWWHLIAGYSSPLWETPTSNISYVDHSWYNSIKDFLQYANGAVHIPSNKFLNWQPLREHDIAIMEQISAMDGVSRADLKSFNRCWLFIGVIYLSEISTADGAALTREAWGGTHSRFSPLLWPFQPCPGPQSWRVWRRLLARAFLEDIPKQVTPQTKDLYLLHPLGAWLPGSAWLFRKWSYHFSPSTGQIYHSVRHNYTVYGRRRRSRHRSQLFYAAPAVVTSGLPPDCIPVEELSSSGSILAFRGMLVRRCHTKLPRSYTSFREYISALPVWDQRLLQSVEIMDDEALMNYFLTDAILYVVSDGGADDDRGSYGALLASADTIFVKISGSTEGTMPGSSPFGPKAMDVWPFCVWSTTSIYITSWIRLFAKTPFTATTKASSHGLPMRQGHSALPTSLPTLRYGLGNANFRHHPPTWNHIYLHSCQRPPRYQHPERGT
jgi:hypothetical protein